MQKIMRSGITKAIAFLLILACGVMSIAIFADMMMNMDSDHDYSFEPDFKYSRSFNNAEWEMRSALNAASPAEAAKQLENHGYLFNISSPGGESYSGGIDTGTESHYTLPYWFKIEKKPLDIIIPFTIGPAVTTAPIEQAQLDTPNAANPITPVGPISPVDESSGENNGAADGDEKQSYMDNNSAWHFFSDTDEYIFQTGQWEGINSNEYHEIYFDWAGEWTVYVGMSTQMYDGLFHDWQRSRKSVMEHLYILIGIAVLALLLIIYMLWVCGRKNGDDDVHTLLIDRFPPELTAVIGLGGSLILGFCCIEVYIEVLVYTGMDLLPLCEMGMAAAMAILAVTLQSLVRNMKNRSFISRMISIKLLGMLWRITVRIFKFTANILRRIGGGLKGAAQYLFGHKISAAVMVIFAGYFLVTALMFGMRMLFVPLILFALAEFVLFRWLSQADKLQTGISEIRCGNTEYKITGCTSPLMSVAAENLNSIGEAVREGVEREVKAQRMKNELITNVSHDLKTPLTSIINYADLLTALELSPAEANDYAKIIRQKGERLKKLTQDLFDISKAESGSESVERENLDMALLLRQSLAELSSEIEKSGLTFVTDIPDTVVPVIGDGKKLSRVFENLLINALKYSMSGTRVYVSLHTGGGKAVAEIKNISAEPMNFDPAEVTERFVRGDRSRSTEGSGLGLAIARSYTELCGGQLKIYVDGDLFKAEVVFNS